jgi:hypothetical protein
MLTQRLRGDHALIRRTEYLSSQEAVASLAVRGMDSSFTAG